MRRSVTAGLVLGLVMLAGCGSSSKSSSPTSSLASTATTSSAPAGAPSGGSSSTVKLAADPSGALKYDVTSLSAAAGKVTIDFTNKSPLPHNVTVVSNAGAIVGATPTFDGGSKSVTLDLRPGTYTFYCSVPGHRQGGMQGTLVVK